VASRSLKAFTLAEVLITLAIIGVVAALTIPSVITNYKNQETVSVLKKTYSSIANTTNLAIRDYGPIASWFEDDFVNGFEASRAYAKKYVTPYLRVSKSCETQSNTSCGHEIKYRSNEGLKAFNLSNRYKFYLADGTFVAMSVNNSGTGTGRHLNAAYLIDINGDKKPNIIGQDVYSFMHLMVFQGRHIGGKLLPHCIYDENAQCTTEQAITNCNSEGPGLSCVYLIFSNGWKIPSKEEYVNMGGDVTKYPW